MKDRRKGAGAMRVGQLRQAFIGSTVSLVLCCAMLAGTTYAWFTERVSAGAQTIQSGNLDVRLRYRRSLEDQWKVVSAKASGEASLNVGVEELLTDRAWQAGDVEYVFLEVTNTGSLPIAYHLMVGAGSRLWDFPKAATPAVADMEQEEMEAYSDTTGLLDRLRVGCIRGDWYEEEAYKTAFPDAAKMIEMAEEDEDGCSIAEGYWSSYELEGGKPKVETDGEAQEEVPDQSGEYGENQEIITLVIYMPPEAGDTLLEGDADEGISDQAEFSVKFVATQLGWENSEGIDGEMAEDSPGEVNEAEMVKAGWGANDSETTSGGPGAAVSQGVDGGPDVAAADKEAEKS